MRIFSTKTVFLTLLTFTVFGSCWFVYNYLSTIKNQHDAYNYYPLNHQLTLQDLKKASQIIPVDTSNLILVTDITEREDIYNPHLLFFAKENNALVLKTACYFSSERVDSILGKKIIASLNTYRQQRSDSFKKDLPPGFQLKYNNSNNSKGRKSDKLIQSIYANKELSVIIHTLVSDNNYEGLQKDTKPEYEKFYRPYTLSLALSELQFDYTNHIVFQTIQSSSNTGLVIDQMIVENSSLIDNFYEELLESINTYYGIRK